MLFVWIHMLLCVSDQIRPITIRPRKIVSVCKMKSFKFLCCSLFALLPSSLLFLNLDFIVWSRDIVKMFSISVTICNFSVADCKFFVPYQFLLPAHWAAAATTTPPPSQYHLIQFFSSYLQTRSILLFCWMKNLGCFFIHVCILG